MHEEQGKSDWVILSCEAESIVENLLRSLEASGICLERLTLVRVEREIANRTIWGGERAVTQSDSSMKKDDRPSQVRVEWSLPDVGRRQAVLWGLVLAVLGPSIGVPLRILLGFERVSSSALLLLFLLLFLCGSITSVVITRLRGTKIQQDTVQATPITCQTETPPERVEPILIGIKIARDEVRLVKEIAREVVTRGI
jgi:hypothetical protein